MGCSLGKPNHVAKNPAGLEALGPLGLEQASRRSRDRLNAMLEEYRHAAVA